MNSLAVWFLYFLFCNWIVLDYGKYVLFNVLLQYIILTKEKQHILFTHPVRHPNLLLIHVPIDDSFSLRIIICHTYTGWVAVLMCIGAW